jgi:predicted Zn-dependent protease
MFRQPFRCLLERTRAAEEAGRYTEAEELLRRVLARAPEHREARLLRGRIWVRRGWVREAIHEFRALVDEDAGNVDARLHLAGALLATGCYSEGIDEIHTIACQAVEESSANALGDAPPLSGREAGSGIPPSAALFATAMNPR